ncbi:HNH endonuclease [Chryseobacterium sp.]|uniref:HNH endonuclease n=1 Tax=Chryseobacterium sp. TaxID=1871047 RepID=UPI0024E25002|nr:HNH endonuclease [Chryseobacterium sp.]
MLKYCVEFVVTGRRFEFEVRSSKKEYLDKFLHDLFSIFSTYDEEKDIHVINGITQNNIEFREALLSFVNKYVIDFPELNALQAQLNSLSEGEIFIFIPSNKYSFKDRTIMGFYLKSQNKGQDFEKLKNDFEINFKNIIDNYEVLTFGEYRRNIGNKNKLQRVCRFCKKKSPDVTFKSKAHAISEAIGNKTLILFDECDSCNKKFSEYIEGDIIEYLSLYRAFFSIKGKDGLKRYKGKNFTLFNDNGLKLTFDSLDDRPKNPKENYEVKLQSQNPICLQNIYKTLCKYFLSVMDVKELGYFENTIEWINGNIEIEKLPKIIEITTYEHFGLQPQLITYVRNNDNENIPYAVCELQFTCLKKIFIIPFSDKDKADFSQSENYENFKKTFNHYEKQYNCAYNDFSNNKKREFNLTLNFEVNKNDS